jgi:RHS repeat-associated protein
LYGPLVDQVLEDEQLASLPGTGRQLEDWAGSVLWPLADHLGTLRDLAAYDPYGVPGQETSLASHRTFDSFGNLVDETNPAVDILFAFTGRDRDEETGLQYHRARYYDPTLGRWLSEDPIGFAGDPWNLYRYVGNAPTMYTDPSGLEPPFHWPPVIAPSGPWQVPLPPPRPVPKSTPVPGSRNDMPPCLPGAWNVSLCVEPGNGGVGHAWILYEQLDKDGNPTGVFHTAGKYGAGYGGWAGEPVAVPGAQWDLPADRRRTEGGKYVRRTKTVIDPKPIESLGYGRFEDNCATYARDAWYHHTGEWYSLPGPDLPDILKESIEKANSKERPSPYRKF